MVGHATARPTCGSRRRAGDGEYLWAPTRELSLVEQVLDYFELCHVEWFHPDYRKKDSFPVLGRSSSILSVPAWAKCDKFVTLNRWFVECRWEEIYGEWHKSVHPD